MANNPKEPLSNYFERDIVKGKRSNFNVSYKNRFTMDFGYLIPAGLWDIPADFHFECDLHSVISSNPTLAPVLGKMKFRAEAYFVEKAAYVQSLRDNDKVPIDRNVPFPTFHYQNRRTFYSAKGSITDFLQMYPAGWSSFFVNGSDIADSTPNLNAIPFIMYYDIYRNYYCNPQDDNIPIRDLGYHAPIVGSADTTYFPIRDVFVTRQQLDDFVRKSRDSQSVDAVFLETLHISPFSTRVDNGQISVEVTPLQHALGSHHGLMRRTLNNDFFTSFVSNDNVALMRKYSTLYTQQDQNGHAIQMEQIVMANRNWRLATRSLLWGTDWKDFNKVHYGVDLLIPYGKPQFLGAISSDVIFNDVISQAQTGDNSGADAVDITSNRNLGSRSGLAFGALKNSKKFIEFNTKDEGYVMVLLSIVPEVDYFQGIDPMYFKTNLQHSWMQEYNSIGMQDFHQSWACAVPNSSQIGPVGWPSLNNALWKVPIWFEYMAKYNQLHADFTADFLNRYWVFSRPFSDLNTLFGNGVFNDPTDPDLTGYEVNYSTYVLPEMYNYIFANVAGQDNFQVQVRFDARLNCMLDKQVISYL